MQLFLLACLRLTAPWRSVMCVPTVCKESIWKRAKCIWKIQHMKKAKLQWQTVMSWNMQLKVSFHAAIMISYNWCTTLLRVTSCFNLGSSRLLRQSLTDWYSGKVVIVARQMIPLLRGQRQAHSPSAGTAESQMPSTLSWGIGRAATLLKPCFSIMASL